MMGVSQSSPKLVNKYIVYTNLSTGKHPGSLHIGTEIAEFPLTCTLTADKVNVQHCKASTYIFLILLFMLFKHNCVN